MLLFPLLLSLAYDADRVAEPETYERDDNHGAPLTMPALTLPSPAQTHSVCAVWVEVDRKGAVVATTVDERGACDPGVHQTTRDALSQVTYEPTVAPRRYTWAHLVWVEWPQGGTQGILLPWGPVVQDSRLTQVPEMVLKSSEARVVDGQACSIPLTLTADGRVQWERPTHCSPYLTQMADEHLPSVRYSPCLAQGRPVHYARTLVMRVQERGALELSLLGAETSALPSAPWLGTLPDAPGVEPLQAPPPTLATTSLNFRSCTLRVWVDGQGIVSDVTQEISDPHGCPADALQASQSTLEGWLYPETGVAFTQQVSVFWKPNADGAGQVLSGPTLQTAFAMRQWPPTLPSHPTRRDESCVLVLSVSAYGQARILESYCDADLLEVATAATDKWNFVPAYRDGRPVASILQLHVPFLPARP